MYCQVSRARKFRAVKRFGVGGYHEIFVNWKPQIMAPRVTPLEGVYTSTVAPVDVAHTYGSPPYVDIAARYALQGIRWCGVEGTQSCASGERVHVCPARTYLLFGSREPLGFGLENQQGFGLDKRGFVIAYLR